MFTQLISITSVIIAIVALYIAVRQTTLNRKAIQADTFITIVNTARTIRFSQGMDIIRQLNYHDYNIFRKNETAETQEHIREVVDFLNDISHLIKHEYITEEHVLNLYFLSIMACNERLLPWWLEGFRNENGNKYYYLNFELLCNMVDKMGEGKLELWHSKDTKK